MLTFDDSMVKGTGNIVIYDSSDNVFETIALTDANVTVSTTQVTINPSGTMASATGYYVKIDATALDDDAGNSYAGIADKTTWNFIVADTTAPTISGGALASDNAYVSVTFDEGVYNTNGGSGDLETSDFSLTFTQNSGNATAATISGVKNNSGGALSGGETVIRVELSITGTPSGVETVEVKPAENSIYDAAGNPAATSETTGAKTLNDQLAPTVSGVTSAKADGAYTTGEVIDITVTFSEAVNVAGAPYLEIETGTTDRNAAYQSGTGTATLTFRYTAQTGDTSSDLNYKTTTSLKLNGGTIKDGAGNDATLTLPVPGEANSLGANKALVIDANDPDTASVTAPVNGTTYNAASVPTTFTGQVGDDASGAGMNADSATFYIKDTTDTKYWDGDAWEDAVTWLATTHDATTDNTTGSWTDNITLPNWTDAHGYEVKAKATDKAGNTLEGTAVITFVYDVTNPLVTINNIADSVRSLAQIGGTESDTSPGQVASVQISINDTTVSKYWDGNSWEDAEAWLNATASANWTYDTSSVTFSNGHAFTVKAKSTDEAGNTSTEATDSFTYVRPSSGGGGAAPVPPSDTQKEDILATSPDATGTDTDGNELNVTGGDITVTTDEETLNVNIPVALDEGATLDSFTDPNGVTFKDNTLVIPSQSAETGSYRFQIVDEEKALQSALTIKTGDATGTGTTAVAEVLSINAYAEFTTKDFTSEDSSLGEVASTVTLDLNTLPVDAEVKITTSLESDTEAQSAFQLAATAAGMGNFATAYVINITKTNLENDTDIQSANIIMKVGTGWVETHGGVDEIKIYRFDPESGEQQILETQCLGYDEQGRAIFEGVSPDGLSVFGLIGKVTESVNIVVSPPAATPEQVEEVAEPATFTVSNLEVTPSQVMNGEVVTITADVVNTGDVEGSYTAVLKINGIVETSQEVTLDADASQQVSFSITRNVADTYTVDINGLTDSFTVRAEEAPAASPPAIPAASPPTAPFNWPLIAGIITGVIIVAGLIVFLSARRKIWREELGRKMRLIWSKLAGIISRRSKSE